MREVSVEPRVKKQVVEMLRRRSMDTSPIEDRWSNGTIRFSDLHEVQDLIDYLSNAAKRSSWFRRFIDRLKTLADSCHREGCEEEKYMFGGCEYHWWDYRPRRYVPPHVVYKAIIHRESQEYFHKSIC